MARSVYVFCQLFYPELISSGQTVTQLCEALTKKGMNITVFCSQPTITSRERLKKQIRYQSITINRLWSTQFKKLSFLGKLCNHLTFGLSCFWQLFWLPKNAPILVFTNPPFLPILFKIMYPIKKFRYHVVVFDVYPETLIVANLLSQSHWFSRWLASQNKAAYQLATQVIVIGRCMKQLIDSHFKDTQKESVYIPMWSDDAMLESPDDASFFRKQWNLNQSFIVGYAGNMASFHPIETIMEASLQLQSEPNIAFVFVGEGAKKDYAIQFSQTHQLTNCYFHTYVKRQELPNLLASFNCGLLGLLPKNTGLSVPSKAFGLLSAGIPSIACCDHLSEIAMIFKENDCGLVSSPDNPKQLVDAILTLKNNPELCKHYSKQAKKAVKSRYNLDSIATQYFQLLTQS